MSRGQRVADAIERSVSGPMWHGPAIMDLIADVHAEDALAHPIAGAHSIWELVLHVAVWAEVALARLGPEPLAAPEHDWPAVPEPTAAHWTDAVARLHASHEQLAHAVENLDDVALRTPVALPGPRHTIEVMLHGVVEHGTYHGGQIMLLRRAAETPVLVARSS